MVESLAKLKYVTTQIQHVVPEATPEEISMADACSKKIATDGNVYDWDGRAHVLVFFRQDLVLPQFPPETTLTDGMRYSVFYCDTDGNPFHYSKGISARKDGEVWCTVTDDNVKI
jgi:hypothetical protein